jgi:hypothetical protein
MDHVKSRGFWYLLLRSSGKIGGFEPGVDLLGHVKSRGFWFLLLRSSRISSVVSKCWDMPIPESTGIWVLLKSCKVLRVSASFTL